jgi:cell division protein FtsB
MWTQQKKVSSLGAYIVPAVCAVVSAYFAHHSLDGRYGSEAREKLRVSVVEAQARLDDLKTERLGLEHKVALLRTGTIERDTLDENARKSLGFIGLNDVQLVVPNG